MRNMPGVAALLGLILLTGGCSQHRSGDRIPNQIPHVRLTGGPREGSRSLYQAHLFWSGWDDDGVIARYEVTQDPPDVFSYDEISSPETAPGVTVEPIPGFTANGGRLRVRKTVDGVTYSFDWLETVRTDRIFVLSASESDSVFDELGRHVPGRTASDVHRVYVRAMDDKGAYSQAEHVGLTAFTYTPTSWVVFPDIRREVLHTGEKVIIKWDGNDPDPPPQGRAKPAGYDYKLIDLHSLNPPLNVVQVTDPQRTVYNRAAGVPWVYQSAESTETVLHVPPGEYLFALRAVDAVGGVEPFVEWRRGQEPPGNAFLLLVTESGGTPLITVNEENLGSFEFRGSKAVYEIEVPVGTRMQFRWNATAEEYGGRIEGYSWGFDIADLDQDGPGSGWSAWGESLLNTPPLSFNSPATHVLYIRARDSNGSITTGAIVMKVFDMLLNQEVLFLDDFTDRIHPLDREHDEFWRSLFVNSGRFSERDIRPDRYLFETGGEGDKNGLNPQPPSLSTLGKYKLLVWSVFGAGYDGRTGLLNAAFLSKDLRFYLHAGGKLWLVGPMSLAPTLGDPPRCTPFGCITFWTAHTTYPVGYVPGDFAWDMLKIRTEIVNNDSGTDWWNDLVRADAWNPGNPIFPTLEPDPVKVGPAWTTRGITHVDAVFAPMLLNNTPSFAGHVDSLYAYVAAGPVRKPGDEKYVSIYPGKLIATRWHDPDPDRDQGRVMWFGFPLYYMKDSQVQETFNRAIDWFREEALPAGEP